MDIAGIVVIVALTEANQLVLIEQYRPAVDRNVIELPAGLAGDTAETADETLEHAALRELLEEAGYRADGMHPLFRGPPSAGITSEQLSFFLAVNPRREGPGGGDGSEEITVHAVPLEDVPLWLQRQSERGRAIDIKIYAGLYAAQAACRR
jgi:ADP-ribose pyrophosphatase